MTKTSVYTLTDKDVVLKVVNTRYKTVKHLQFQVELENTKDLKWVMFTDLVENNALDIVNKFVCENKGKDWEFFAIEDIVDKRVNKRMTEYSVKWVGHTSPSWHSKGQMTEFGFKQYVEEYELKHMEYDVEKVVDTRTQDGNDQALLKWEGFGEDANTWEPLENLSERVLEMVEDLRKGACVT